MTVHIEPVIPKAFVWRRLHSLMGIWLVIFLIQHLFVNSQAALFIGADGAGFIKGVNSIHELPYLPIIEIAILGFPLFVHIVWGIKYLFTAKPNSYGNTGKDPYLPEYSRNRAYTWQRITSWILVVAILAHVIHMRFIQYPTTASKGTQHYYMVRVSQDEGLYTLASRLGVELYDQKEVQKLKEELRNPALKNVQNRDVLSSFFFSLKDILQKPKDDKEKKEEAKPQSLLLVQEKQQERAWIEALEKHPLSDHQLMAVAGDFGTAELLMLRDTFKMPIMLVLYTLFVLFACFHAFNGLWTFLITWGITLTNRSQKIFLKLANFLMVIITFLGLAAVWATYWINLKQ